MNKRKIEILKHKSKKIIIKKNKNKNKTKI